MYSVTDMCTQNKCSKFPKKGKSLSTRNSFLTIIRLRGSQHLLWKYFHLVAAISIIGCVVEEEDSLLLRYLSRSICVGIHDIFQKVLSGQWVKSSASRVFLKVVKEVLSKVGLKKAWQWNDLVMNWWSFQFSKIFHSLKLEDQKQASLDYICFLMALIVLYPNSNSIPTGQWTSFLRFRSRLF